MMEPMPHTHTISTLFKALNYILLSTSFLATSLGLDIEARYWLLALGGSLAGSVVLQYVQRENVRAERFFKGLGSMVSGLIIGAAVIENRQIQAPAYIGLTYFITSLVSLMLVRATVLFVKTNGRTIVVTFFQQFTGRQQ